MRGLPVSSGARRLGGRVGGLAALLAACQVATLLHLALVPHSLGADGHLRHTAAHAATASRVDVPPGAAASPGSPDEDDHACAAEAVLRALAGVEAPSGHVALTLPCTAAAPPCPSAVSPPRALHHLAPKQSPPALV
jgi:hypothetical protein